MADAAAPAPPPAPRARERALLLALLALAAGVRIWRLDHGLPDVTRVDAFKFVGPAARWAQTGVFELVDYQYPGLYPLLLAGLYGGLGIGSEYAQHLAASGVAAAFGVAAMLAVWGAAGAWCGTAGRALAAALTAVSPVLVSYSRIPSSDGVVAFFFAAALACLGRWPAAWAGAAGAGACIGLATGTKFSGALGGTLVLATLLLRDLPARDARRLAAHAGAALLAFGAAFLATTPWFFARANDYAARLSVEALIQSGGRIGRAQAGLLDYLVSSTPTWEAPWLGSSILGTEGPLVLGAGIAALALALWQRPPPPALAGAAVCVIVALAAQSGAGRLKAIRFLAPLLPLVFVAIGWLVDPRGRRWPARWLILPIAALLALPALRTARYLALFDGPPTQTLARAWIHASLPAGTPVFLAPFHLDSLDDGHLSVWRIPDVGSRQYRFPPGVGPSAERDLIYFPGLLARARRNGVQYFITNSFFDGAFAPVPENLEFFPRATAGYRAFRARLEREATQVHEVAGFAEGRMGPDIEVWRLEPPPPAPAR